MKAHFSVANASAGAESANPLTTYQEESWRRLLRRRSTVERVLTKKRQHAIRLRSRGAPIEFDEAVEKRGPPDWSRPGSTHHYLPLSFVRSHTAPLLPFFFTSGSCSVYDHSIFV